METMITDKKDQERIIALLQENTIKKIWIEHCPQYSYDDVYFAALGAGERSSHGIKRMITGRLKKLPTLSTSEQKDMIDEVAELVQCLYNRQKGLQKKMSKIRDVVEQ